MTKVSVVYEEETVVIANYYNPKSDDFLEYFTKIQIKSSGKTPIEAKLKFIGIPPYAAPMPPEEHTVKAKSIFDLYAKLVRWFNKFGYRLT